MSTMQNPSIVLYSAHTAKLEDRPIPPLTNPHDVLIRIAYIGVCGSDVHFWHHGGIGKSVNPATGIVMGHEASGTVHSVGSAVTPSTTIVTVRSSVWIRSVPVYDPGRGGMN